MKTIIIFLVTILILSGCENPFEFKKNLFDFDLDLDLFDLNILDLNLDLSGTQFNFGHFKRLPGSSAEAVIDGEHWYSDSLGIISIHAKVEIPQSEDFIIKDVIVFINAPDSTIIWCGQLKFWRPENGSPKSVEIVFPD